MGRVLVALINQFGPIADGKEQIARKYEVEAVWAPHPGLLNIIKLKATIWRNPGTVRGARTKRE